MALWIKDATGDQFDDGLAFKPGEEGFTRELAAEHFKTDAFSYSGTPNWKAPEPPPEVFESPQPADPVDGAPSE